MFNQIPFMKSTKILALVALLTVAVSCSKDDEPAPRVEDIELSFADADQIVEVPEALLNSEDPHANLAASLVMMANGLSSNLALFEAPNGATRTTNFIVPVNGRTAADKGYVYTWTDPEYGTVAYQVREASDKYVFEFLYKETGSDDWYRYLYAEERKDRSEGHFIIYNAWDDSEEDFGEEIMRWTWTRKGDMFTFRVIDATEGFNFKVEVNTKTKAGSVVYFNGELKEYEIVWDAQGKGTWKYFDESGEVTEEGSWE
jgi:hypothetical protein